MAKRLRDYQQNAINACTEELDKGVSTQMLVMATGTGKTFTACKIAEQYQRVLWLTHTEELIDQSGMALALTMANEDMEGIVEKHIQDHNGILDTLEFLDKNPLFSMDDTEKYIKENIGVIKRKRMDLNAKIVVASIQTIWRRLDKIDPGTFDIIIVDEAHYAMAKTWKKTVDHFNTILRLGLTATPNRLDNLSLGHLFEKIVFEYSIRDAILEGWLVEIDAIRIRTDINLDTVRTTAGELNQKDLQLVNCPERNNLIVDKYEEYALDQQGIIFCVDVAHAVELTEVFSRRGHKSVNFVVGNTDLCPDRKMIIRRFKEGKIKILINVMILTTGFDYPGIKWIGMACPTKSLTKYLQQLGRGTRPPPRIISIDMELQQRIDAIANSQKPKLILMDFVDVSSRHKLVNCWNLDKGKTPDEKTFITKEARDKLNAERTEREVRIDRLTQKDQRVDLIEMPEWKLSDSPKMNDPATEKQLALMGKWGYDVTGNYYSKADAAKIISSQPASEKQISYLRRLGYNAKASTTLGEASLAFKQVEEVNRKKIIKAQQSIANNITKDMVKNEGPAF